MRIAAFIIAVLAGIVFLNILDRMIEPFRAVAVLIFAAAELVLLSIVVFGK